MVMDRENYKKLLHSISVPGALPAEEKSKRYKPIIDFLQTEIPSALYRYRSCGELSFGAFSEDQLWFSKPKVMNDDFDALISYAIPAAFAKSMLITLQRSKKIWWIFA